MLGAGLIFFLAVLQGATELFPVSSLGHAVLVPSLLHLNFNPSDPSFVPVLTVLHLGTAFALIVLYRQQWWRIIAGLARAVIRGGIVESDERLGLMLIVATIPAGFIGLVFETQFKKIFGDPRAAAAFLLVNGGILLTAEWFRRRDERRRASEPDRRGRHSDEAQYLEVERLTFPKAIIVGLCQVAALFPGISRSGITMSAGLVAGLRHEEAARFSFLLATPIILAAGVLETLELGSNRPTALIAAGAAALAGVVAYMSARFLLRYLRFGRLDPFAYYCAALGITGLILTR
ncbi:MAG TPA: undecaprenyl-diphosphate phosphatase [Candidatus Dormibacteraeota bacterium]